MGERTVYDVGGQAGVHADEDTPRQRVAGAVAFGEIEG